MLERVGAVVSTRPPGDFDLHTGLQRILKARLKMLAEREADWALAEAMAFGSLLLEGALTNNNKNRKPEIPVPGGLNEGRDAVR